MCSKYLKSRKITIFDIFLREINGKMIIRRICSCSEASIIFHSTSRLPGQSATACQSKHCKKPKPLRNPSASPHQRAIKLATKCARCDPLGVHMPLHKLDYQKAAVPPAATKLPRMSCTGYNHTKNVTTMKSTKIFKDAINQINLKPDY